MGESQSESGTLRSDGQYRIEFLPSAVRELGSLPRSIQQRLSRRIDALRENPRPEGAKALQGSERMIRLRVGDYRVLYKVDDDRHTVLVVRIGHRREVYRKT